MKVFGQYAAISCAILVMSLAGARCAEAAEEPGAKKQSTLYSLWIAGEVAKSDPEKSARIYEDVLNEFRRSETGYSYWWAKVYAEKYVELLRRQKNEEKAAQIENEFCKDKCGNPWSESKVPWKRYHFALPENSGSGFLDVRPIHPFLAEYAYRLRGELENKPFVVQPCMQTGGAANLRLDWIAKNSKEGPFLIITHDVEGFPGTKIEVLDFTTGTLSESMPNSIKDRKRVELGYLDAGLQFKTAGQQSSEPEKNFREFRVA